VYHKSSGVLAENGVWIVSHKGVSENTVPAAGHEITRHL